jgi:acyl-coenzyme A synthetase/AMP-(fatty) acid ligase
LQTGRWNAIAWYKKGDTVVIYMPMIPQADMAMLAGARPGAVHSVVFGGLAPHELALRIDDIINVSGHRLSTGEMEEILASHQAVAECAVIGFADELRGQRPIGIVVLKDEFDNLESELENELCNLVRNKIGAITFFKNNHAG